ncbi:MAG: ABC transporter permease [Acidimicrobiia bacterium]|nr:ABC transporter permease [Acidimicrobiia bacterium]
MTTDAIVPLSWYKRLSVRSLLAKSLWDRRTMTLLIGIGIGLMALLVTGMFPSLEEALVDFDMGQGVTDLLGGASLATPEGWLSAEVWSIVAPFGIVALVMIDGARSIASEEEERSIGLLAANPIGRIRILRDKSIALVVHALIAASLIGLFSWVSILIIGLDMDASKMWAATLHLAMLGFMFAGTTALVSTIVGKRTHAILIVFGIAGVAYILAAMLPLFEGAADWAKISPWFYYWGDNPLVGGVNWGYIGIMAAITAALFVAAGYLFTKRDLPG